MNDKRGCLRLCGALAVVLTTLGCDGGPSPAREEEPQAEEPEAGEAGAVHLTARQMEELGVEVAVAVAGEAASLIERPATVLLDADRVALIGPRIEAKVERVLRDLGDRVRRGEALAVMSSVELGEARAQHMALKARLATARAAFERERRLFEDRISSEAEVLEAEATYRAAQADVDVVHERLRLYGLAAQTVEAAHTDSEEPLSFFRLRSPVSGVVQQRALSPGQTVGPGDTPVHVARIDSLWVMIDAYEQDIRYLATGQEVSLTVRSMPDRAFEAETDWVSAELDPETRTIAVRAVAANPEGLLRPGMFGTAVIRTGETMVEWALLPVDAVQTLEGRPVVFTVGDEAGEFRPVAVRLGAERADRVEVISGVVPGDSVVVAGAFELMSAATSGGRSAEHGH